MKDNKITIQINKPARDVYAFYINPKNTPLWINSIVEEETNEWPIKIGTIYRNKNRQGQLTEYVVTALKENRLFELKTTRGNYHVRYTHRNLDNGVSELEYYEWVDNGNIEAPFTLDMLNKLKEIIEK
ncbi:hypothetical protein COS31_04815 [Candidatus Roizmanbacteria bacterium CG02_land_8_20_14_3_00_36_15]|uniref:Polyketide cyclase n=3 Tax=Candidatus Roizmaniibacteriota TaxID=1752723 RepID=A0A2M8F2U9_9BACT|nr:MAG: hypothetical protein COS51_01885 [Candidatus Roizmanbacteria bacterium CG03_land_8_20_14_0_80_36_21]PIV37487.1 MAG: hypothetical protein COS31_04815 [Candidatus Roizmanbacteria bacterium CG02_land_8_20_14_3_00_36_15]PIY70563.1 MAG: hypothetical protein COY89_00870 [Candidatus Roizmanbacteria bacterium CG_4_10_14_0_8_um_filter_36_36]PJA52471.1 MAG: hypothetical protein CO166_05720 [Candidatus Roizmanbacteria bacterium CG_4_9_14_3_um_filter_36_11]PJC33606.1 MAG: hypothetical protein CO049